MKTFNSIVVEEIIKIDETKNKWLVIISQICKLQIAILVLIISPPLFSPSLNLCTRFFAWSVENVLLSCLFYFSFFFLFFLIFFY